MNVIDSKELTMLSSEKLAPGLDPGVVPSSDQVRGHAFRQHALRRARLHRPRIMLRILLASASTAKGLVIIAMPGSRKPLAMVAFSAYPVMNSTFRVGR